MADVHDKKTRSYNMSRIKGKDTKPEILVRKFLFSKGFRYRLHDKGLPGKPDLVLPKYKTVIFVHGCFWHGHEGCKYAVIPKTRTEWWRNKIGQTKIKDGENIFALKRMGWKVIEVWECELKKDQREKTLEGLVDFIKRNGN
jgi:DNA mismatch endonuclease (patch repair protein)